ncbi:hypothetical protein MHYP_G00181680 [Metynnis hypsauchen]
MGISALSGLSYFDQGTDEINTTEYNSAFSAVTQPTSLPLHAPKKSQNQYSQPLSDCPVFSKPLIAICLCIATVLLGILLALLWITLEASVERLPARCECTHTYVHPLAPIAPLNQVRRRHLCKQMSTGTALIHRSVVVLAHPPGPSGGHRKHSQGEPGLRREMRRLWGSSILSRA